MILAIAVLVINEVFNKSITGFPFGPFVSFIHLVVLSLIPIYNPIEVLLVTFIWKIIYKQSAILILDDFTTWYELTVYSIHIPNIEVKH